MKICMDPKVPGDNFEPYELCSIFQQVRSYLNRLRQVFWRICDWRRRFRFPHHCRSRSCGGWPNRSLRPHLSFNADAQSDAGRHVRHAHADGGGCPSRRADGHRGPMAEFPYHRPCAASATGGGSGCPCRGSNTGASHGAGADLMAQKLRLRPRRANNDKMCACRRASWQHILSRGSIKKCVALICWLPMEIGLRQPG